MLLKCAKSFAPRICSLDAPVSPLTPPASSKAPTKSSGGPAIEKYEPFGTFRGGSNFLRKKALEFR